MTPHQVMAHRSRVIRGTVAELVARAQASRMPPRKSASEIRREAAINEAVMDARVTLAHPRITPLERQVAEAVLDAHDPDWRKK